jgi:hypothetical protein
MPLPPSFKAMGFVTPEQARHKAGAKTRRLMIATEGKSDTGKTEFMLTCPGPGLIIALDRGFDAMCDNPEPPPTRRDDFAIKVIAVPTATQFADAKDYLPYWKAFYNDAYRPALENAEAVTVGLDGDNHSWDLQRLAEHGKLTGVFPQTRYTDVYAARRAMYFRAWDSGKIIIASNMVRDEYRDVLGPDGMPVQENGQTKREKTGNYVANGFPDQDYLWQIRIRHLYEPPKFNTVLKRMTEAKWGLRVLKAKANPRLVGTELWGEDCTFAGLVQTVYPQIPLSEWGL